MNIELSHHFFTIKILPRNFQLYVDDVEFQLPFPNGFSPCNMRGIYLKGLIAFRILIPFPHMLNFDERMYQPLDVPLGIGSSVTITGQVPVYSKGLSIVLPESSDPDEANYALNFAMNFEQNQHSIHVYKAELPGWSPTLVKTGLPLHPGDKFTIVLYMGPTSNGITVLCNDTVVVYYESVHPPHFGKGIRVKGAVLIQHIKVRYLPSLILPQSSGERRLLVYGDNVIQHKMNVVVANGLDKGFRLQEPFFTNFTMVLLFKWFLPVHRNSEISVMVRNAHNYVDGSINFYISIYRHSPYSYYRSTSLYRRTGNELEDLDLYLDYKYDWPFVFTDQEYQLVIHQCSTYRYLILVNNEQFLNFTYPVYADSPMDRLELFGDFILERLLIIKG
ncbi:uncharacterized protein LOC111087166 [Limulus polyphemus]|uniref:Galectin n=1 Tax=Limulus polyphemus TaxID=6850 RepID=A0ABM1SY46_LIMPO|nr:uncharacterized protein LOC111087166 [Limulus polyphemus]